MQICHQLTVDGERPGGTPGFELISTVAEAVTNNGNVAEFSAGRHKYLRVIGVQMMFDAIMFLNDVPLRCRQ